MKLKFLAAALAASSLVAAPVSAAAANPAASLSVAKSVRAGTPAAAKSKIAEGSTATLIGIGILVAFTAVVLATTGGDDSDSSDSN